MTRLFVSYSKSDSAEAGEVLAWLEGNGWKDDVFIDVHPDHGIAGGATWRKALRDAAGRCEAVLLLMSRAWIASKVCWNEFTLAEKYGKPCIPIRIDDYLAMDAIPHEITDTYQIIDKVTVPIAEFNLRLKRSLEVAGAGPENFALPVGRRPYPGLQALCEEDAALFFGRDAEVLSALDALRDMRATGRRRLLSILGASGAGKSSLLRAGLWPRIDRDDRQFLALPVIRPANAALGGKEGLWRSLEVGCADLRRSLHLPPDMPRTRASLRERIEAEPNSISSVLTSLKRAGWRALGDPAARLPSVVLFIDQAEELFNPDGAFEADSLLHLLNSVWANDPEFLVVLAIRSDVYPRLQGDHRIDQEQVRPFNLPPMSPAGMIQVIEGPADRVGLKLDPQLASALLIDAKGSDALPLLAFTLERLYDERLANKALLLSDYKRLGGVRGAIEAAVGDVRKQAEDDGLSGPKLDQLLRRVFLPRLARINEGGEYARRVANYREFEPECRQLIDLLIAQRLLVSDQRQDIRTIEIAHEAILREWPLLAGWLDAERGFLEWREQVARSRGLYQRDQGDLLSGRALLVSQGFLETRRDLIEADDIRFIEDSETAEALRLAEAEAEKEAKRKIEIDAARAREEAALAASVADRKLAEAARRSSRNMRRVAVAMLMLGLGAAGAGYLAYTNELEAKSTARKANEAATLAQTARFESESRRLAGLAEEVRRRDEDNKALALAWLGVPKSSDAAAVNDEVAASVYKQSAAIVRTLTNHAQTAFSSDGNLAISVLLSGTAELWETRSGSVLKTFDKIIKPDQDGGQVAWFTYDGQSVLLLHDDYVLRRWDIKNGRMLSEFKVLETEYYKSRIVLSDDGTHVFIVRPGGRAEIHDLRTSGKIVLLRMPNVYFDDLIDKNPKGGLSFQGGAFSHNSKIFLAEFVKERPTRFGLWNTETGQLIRLLDEEFSDQGLQYHEFSQNDELVLLSPGNSQLFLLSTRNGRYQQSFPASGMREASFTSDEKGVLAFVESYDSKTPELDKFSEKLAAFSLDGKLAQPFIGRADIHSIANNKTAVITAAEDEATVWNINSATIRSRLRGHHGKIFDVAISPDSKTAMTISEDRTIKLWDAAHGKPIATFPLLQSWKDEASDAASESLQEETGSELPVDDSASISFHDAGTLAIIEESGDPKDPSRNSIRVIRARADLSISTPIGGVFRRVLFTPDGALAIAAGEDNKTRLISPASGRIISELASHSAPVIDLDVSGDGRWAVTASWDGTAKLHDLSRGLPVITLGGHKSGLTNARFSPSGRILATSSHDGTVRLFSVDVNGEVKQQAKIEVSAGSVSSIRFSPDGHRIVTTALDGSVALWESEGGKSISHLPGHVGAAFAANFSPAGDKIVTASADHTARIWNAQSGELLQTLKGHDDAVLDAVWSADGRTVYTASADKTVKMWDPQSGALIKTFRGAVDAVRKAVYSPDGATILAICDDGALRIWDVESGALIATYGARSGIAHDLAVSVDGRVAAVASADGVVNFWTLFPGSLTERIAVVGAEVRQSKPLSAAECSQYGIMSMHDAELVCDAE